MPDRHNPPQFTISHDNAPLFDSINLPATWPGRAACADRDPELWWPLNNTYSAADQKQRAELAKNICGRCPVRRECAKDAVDNDEKDGIWGGVLLSQGFNTRHRNEAHIELRKAAHVL